MKICIHVGASEGMFHFGVANLIKKICLEKSNFYTNEFIGHFLKPN